MKFRFIFPVLALIVLLGACDSIVGNLGVEIQPANDTIVLKSDTFRLMSETVAVDRIVSRPDSVLLGTFIDDYLGTTRADFLTQFAVPTENFVYLDPSVATTQPDSATLTLYFTSHFGVTSSPIELSVYELKKELKEKESYYSDIDVGEYVSFSKKLNEATSSLFTIRDGISGKLQTQLTIKLTDEFTQRLFTTDPENYGSQEGFMKFFKGLYVTSDFGSSAMLNLKTVSLRLHYHYIYNNDPSETKIKSYQLYSANNEVVKVNRVQHPFRILETSPQDEYNYLASPSNYHAKVRIPLGRLRERISVGDKNLDVNSAILRLDIQDSEKWNENSIVPRVQTVMLIRESEVDKFFTEHRLPSDTISFLADLDRENITATSYKYFYSFNNLSRFIQHEIEKNNDEEYIDMVLLPVSRKESTTATGQTSLVSVVQATQLQAVSIFSGNNKERPMRLEVVYSGY